MTPPLIPNHDTGVNKSEPIPRSGNERRDKLTPRYIHIVNWDVHQHRDWTRNKAAAARWIVEKTSQLTDEEYLELGLADRGLLHGLRLQYAANRGRGVNDSTTNLTRILGTRIYRSQLERLYQAGFIEFSAHKTCATCAPTLQDTTKQNSKTLATPSREDVSIDSASSSSAPVLATSGADDSSADEDIVLPGSSKSMKSGTAAFGAGSASRPASEPNEREERPRPRDEVWDELERLFGRVVDKTSAHGARNRAVKDLRAYGATAELVRLAARRWGSLYPSATLTDSAVAKHWPQLTAGARQSTGLPACPGCGVGGGFHAGDCPTVAERPPGDLERFFHDEGEEVA